jgi:predicted nucleotidyltransferase
LHHRPENQLQILLQNKPQDRLQEKLYQLVTILVQYGVDCNFLGLTGSMLINQQTTKSDIDLVVYGRDNFNKVRQAIRLALARGEFAMLDHRLMEENFQRRAGELDFDEFAWHENRKLNKAVIDGSKFDIGMVALNEPQEMPKTRYKKRGNKTIITTIIDDEGGFDFPACYKLADAETPEVIVYTHTYVGQAYKGETVEVSGAVECNMTTGKCRLIVGSSREAKGEYIKVYR